MNLLLPYFIIILLLFQLFMRKNSKKSANSQREFLEREQAANSVRKKNIDNLDYIILPDEMPFPDTSDNEILNMKDRFAKLKGKRILNLTGISNTDLKMEYGVANLQFLSEYDDNYSELVKNIAAAGELLISKGYEAEGIRMLEYGIEYNTDITRNYTILAEYYLKEGNNYKFSQLKKTAEALNSLSKDIILNKLQLLSK